MDIVWLAGIIAFFGVSLLMLHLLSFLRSED